MVQLGVAVVEDDYWSLEHPFISLSADDQVRGNGRTSEPGF